MKHLLTLVGLVKEELYDLPGLADSLKKEAKKGAFTPHLRNKMLGTAFTESSTRTRVSFETGMVQLGGTTLYLSANDMQLGRGEPVKDTARMLSRYLDGIVTRMYKYFDVEKPVEHGNVPIINGLIDYVYPCQIPADPQTIREYRSILTGSEVCPVDVGNSTANSLINGGTFAGMEMACVCLLEYLPGGEITKRAQASRRFTLTQNALEAVKDADVSVTDVWASMGEKQEAAQRRRVFEGIYQISDACTVVAEVDAMVPHCLPVHREEETIEEVFKAYADRIFDKTENRLHAQETVLATLLED